MLTPAGLLGFHIHIPSSEGVLCHWFHPLSQASLLGSRTPALPHHNSVLPIVFLITCLLHHTAASPDSKDMNSVYLRPRFIPVEHVIGVQLCVLNVQVRPSGGRGRSPRVLDPRKRTPLPKAL